MREYNHYSFCTICRLKQPMVRYRCEECNRPVRHTPRHYGKHDIRLNLYRYGIAFIPTAIIVCSNLYNIGFI